MIAGYLLKGMLIGLVFGVPAGAIGALTIQRTLEKGFAAGLVTGMGSSAADLIYSCVGIFGITIISDLLTAHQAVIQLIGGSLILLLGIMILRKKELSYAKQNTKGSPLFCFISAFTAAMFNPTTVLSFMVAFTSFGITGDLNAYEGVSLAAGILTGTLCWWLTLSGVVDRFRKNVTDNIYRRLNRILGSLMILFGIVMMIRGVLKK